VKRFQLEITFLTLFVVLFAVAFTINSYNKNSSIEQELSSAKKELHLNYNIINYYNRQNAKAMHTNIGKNPMVVAIMSQARHAGETERKVLRKKLYGLLEKQFHNAMRLKGVMIVQFILPDNVSFLRMHKPDRHGDYLGDVRYSIRYTNETKRPVFGFEQGKISHAFRNVNPLFDKSGEYVGCYDISFSTESMQATLTKVNKIHSHFLVNKSIFDVKIWERKDINFNYIPSVENDAYMFTVYGEPNHKVLARCKEDILDPHRKRIEERMAQGEEFAIYQEVDDALKVVTFLPISNINRDKTAAYIVAYTENAYIQEALKNFRIVNILSFFIIGALLYLVYKQRVYRNELYTLNENLHHEVEQKTSENIKKDKMLQEQSKLAAMGEMVGAIAHQWRQPLNALGINIQMLEDDYADGIIDQAFLEQFIDKQMDTIDFMSQTIDDFRGFFKVDKEKRVFSVREAIAATIAIQSAWLTNHNIAVKVEGADFEIDSFESEFQQVILNLLSNAKDAIINNGVKQGEITMVLDRARVVIKDNAGGIPEAILDRVFEPYFTTKEQGKGTGIGLYMSKMIIEQNMNGLLSVANEEKGAVFTITFNHVI
jgi:signal transduction histidine kinase